MKDRQNQTTAERGSNNGSLNIRDVQSAPTISQSPHLHSSERNCLHCGNLFVGDSRFCCHACATLYDLDSGSYKIQEQAEAHHLARYAYLDQIEFRSQFQRNENEFVFYVQGLECTSCVHLLEKLPEIDPLIEDASLNFGENTMRVRLAPKGSLARTAALIEEMGYKAIPLTDSEDTESHYKNENRKMLIRMAVAGACAGNIMLFVIPIYAGLADQWREIFNWISFGLFLPVISFCAWPFYKGAWVSLKYKHLSIDLPITIALAVTFIYSTTNLLRGSAEIYFDSTASFMFLILSSRYLVKRLQQSALHDNVLSGINQDRGLLVLDNNRWITKPVDHIKVGDVIKLEADHILPIDGVLDNDSAEFDFSLLTGESMPQLRYRGMVVEAGARTLEKTIVKTTQLPAQTQLGAMLKKIEQESLKNTPFVHLTDQLAQGLIATVFLVAAGYFLLNFQTHFEQSLARSLSLFIIACPCALALGTPLAFAWSLRRAKEKGIIIRSAEIFERLPQVKTLIFDKTGTLTEGRLELLSSNVIPSEEQKKLILSLEAISQHPIARAFRESWKVLSLEAVSEAKELTGLGVTGKWNNKIYSLIRSQDSSDKIKVDLICESEILNSFYFADVLRSESRAEVHRLIQWGYQVFIASGDQQSRIEQIADQLGISRDHAFGNMTPEKKLQLVESHPNCLMIGDGANDSLALQKARVGVAIMGSVSLALSTADIHFIRPGLSPLRELLILGKKANRTLKSNLGFSLIYNFSAGLSALMGWINPLTAAVLMPISSAIIALNTWMGMRDNFKKNRKEAGK